MISHTNTPRRAQIRRPLTLALIAGLLLSLLTFSSQGVSTAQEASPCGPNEELDLIGRCVPTENAPSQCPPGQQPEATTGLGCEPIPADPSNPCSAGLTLVNGECVIDEGGDPSTPTDAPAATACDAGYSVGSDGQTCIADPACPRNELLDDEGNCVPSASCPDGFLRSSDQLSCISDRCPEGELKSVDGLRCESPASDCPDGSPRPQGGACLVVETIKAADGSTEVVVRCEERDTFCQARIKSCADARASGSDELGTECEDPRGSCTGEECEASNERLVECATRGSEEADEDAEPVRIGGDNDACADLCPELHRLSPAGDCVEYLDPKHPCVSFGKAPAGVTTNAELEGYSYLAGLGQCVTRVEFFRRLGNFEAAAGAEADALTLLRETTSSYLTIEEQLVELQAQLEQAEADIAQFTADAGAADRRRVDNAKLLAFAQKELIREEALLRGEVLDVFVLGGNDALVEEAILGSTNVTEISVARVYGETVLSDQVDNIARVTSLKTQTEELAVDLERAAAEVEASLAAAVATSNNLQALQREAEILRAEQLERRDVEAELVAELSVDKANFAQQLGVFEVATREITDIIADAEFRVTAFADFDGLLANPILPETKITSGFGPRLHPILGYVRNHDGVDISAGFGEEILATEDGVVQIASDFGGYGRTVVIDHGGDLLTLYAHMSVIRVEPGDEVKLGDTIGLVGSTGLSTGPHLHFEVWEDGSRAVDPRPYLSDAE